MPGQDPDKVSQFGFVFDETRLTSFFSILFSTTRLLDMTSNSRPLEIDETHKLIYEGYPVTVMGQSDGDRVFHIRAIGVSANSTEEVGSFFMSSWKSYNPSFQPSAYLGDAAEAFANAALQNFFFHQNSADVLHTRIQSKLVEVLYRCKLNEINSNVKLNTQTCALTMI